MGGTVTKLLLRKWISETLWFIETPLLKGF